MKANTTENLVSLSSSENVVRNSVLLFEPLSFLAKGLQWMVLPLVHRHLCRDYRKHG
jgi:hypothetical protein